MKMPGIVVEGLRSKETKHEQSSKISEHSPVQNSGRNKKKKVGCISLYGGNRALVIGIYSRPNLRPQKHESKRDSGEHQKLP